MVEVSAEVTPEDFLILDDQTLKDLEIFWSESGEQNLFEFCNLTRTEGGAKVLRRRMEHPWSNTTRIRATQDSIKFIQKHRETFSQLPAAYVTGRVDHYMNEILPIVVQENSLEFTLGAFSLWSHHDRHYTSIVLGVQVSCKLINALRQFTEPFTEAGVPDSPIGELGPIFEELQLLLGREQLAKVPQNETRKWFWKNLRFDQIFRLHEKVAISRMLHLIFEIDALIAMADATSQNDFTLPQLEDGPLRVQAESLTHPFVDQAVPNPATLDQNKRVLFLTGPNMAGKTTYIRSFATALYLAHLGMGVPAKNFQFVPAQRLFSSISLSDDLRSGISYFKAEALRVKAVAKAIADGYRVVALMDEPFKGTNVKDALDASLAILDRFATKTDCLFIFSSHLIELKEALNDTSQIDCRYFEADEQHGQLSFDYLLRPGVSSQRLGMRVLREEGVFDLLDGTENI
jgi:DNA mismatch repair protein MutS